MNQALRTGLVRFGRNVAGCVIIYGAQVVGDTVLGLKFPEPVAPFVPIVLGPALNALAKVGRLMGQDAVKSVCKAL